MRMQLRRSNERGRTDLGWLDSRHTFSFGGYHDPAWMQFGKLRVLNDDTVAARMGFDPHPHQDMEIVSYVTAGALAHRDSMGHESVVPAGTLQRMSAGRGVVHSEYNASTEDPVHFFQIWIPPRARGIEPEYEELALRDAPLADGWRLAFSPTPGDGAMTLHQDVTLRIGQPAAGQTLALAASPGEVLWVHVARGAVDLNGERQEAGDAAGLEAGDAGGEAVFTAHEDAELLVFSM